MNSNEFEEISKQIEIEKRQFDKELLELLAEKKFGTLEVNRLHSLGCEFFSAFEKYLAKCSDSGLTKTQLVDVRASIENVLNAGAEFWGILRAVGEQNSLKIQPSNNFLSTAQSALISCNKKSAAQLKELYLQKNLPVNGYMTNSINLKEQKIDWGVASAGIILLLVSIGLAFYVRVEDGVQYLVARVAISLAAGLILSAFTKNQIKVNYKHKGATITALGAAATFIIIYFSNPASVPEFKTQAVKQAQQDTAVPTVATSR
jgi:hypothetical protein